jgi:hypothetical protein
MTEFTANEWADRIVRSLKEKSAELAREERARRFAPVRRALVLGGVLAIGIALGALLVTALQVAN